MLYEIIELQESEIKSLVLLLNEHLEDNEENLNQKVLSCWQTMQSNHLTLFVAKDRNITVGYVLIHWLKMLWTDSGEAFISNLYVKPKYRLKGIGTLLLEKAINEVKKRNCIRLFLENNKNNAAYQKSFYSKRGGKERLDISIFEFPINEF